MATQRRWHDGTTLPREPTLPPAVLSLTSCERDLPLTRQRLRASSVQPEPGPPADKSLAMDLDFDVETLISLVRNRPAIWDTKEEIYKDRVAVVSGWREICAHLHPNFQNLSRREQEKYEKGVTVKWKTLRDGFRKSLERNHTKTKSGEPASKLKKYVYHDHLLFLEGVLSFRAASARSERRSARTTPDTTNRTTNEEKPRPLDDIVIPPQQSGEHALTHSPMLTATKTQAGDHSLTHSMVTFPNRHMAFFQGLLPSLECLDDDEVLEFQMGVLGVIKNIKQSKRDSLQKLESPFP